MAQSGSQNGDTKKPKISPLAVYQSTVYGNQTLALKETRQNTMPPIDITDKITIRDTSGEYNETYAAKNIFNDDKESVWSACDWDDAYWIIFDSHGYQITTIDLVFYQYKDDEESVKYGCKWIKLLHGIDLKHEFQSLTDFKFKNEDNEQTLSLTGSNHRLLKLQFEELMCEHGFVLKRIKFYGILQNKTDYQTEEVLYEWEEIKDQNDADFKSDEQSEDISTSHLLKCIESWPSEETPTSQGNDTNHWYSGDRENPRKEAFLVYDVAECSVDSIDIKMTNNAVIKIYTSKRQNDRYQWEMIILKRDVKAGEMTTFYLKSIHEEFIKLSFMTPMASQFDINHLQWNGREPVIENEVTEQICVYQSSGAYRGFNVDRVLQHNSDSWKSQEGIKCYLIFDCGRFEIERIWIQFGIYSKPEIVKLRLSDVPNIYSFNASSTQKWKFKTSQRTRDDREWSNIPLFEVMELGDIYKNGFKRYLQLEFLHYMIDTLEIVEIRFFGKESDQIEADSEQFDDVLDAKVAEEEVKEDRDVTKPYKPKVVDSLPTDNTSGTSVHDIVDHENQASINRSVIWRKKDPFLVIDTGNNEVEQIYVGVSSYDGCKICKVYTSDKIKANDWVLLIAHQNDLSHNAQNKIKLNMKHDKYLKIAFVNQLQKDRLSVLRIWLMGESEYLYKEKKEITMDDINKCAHIDADLIHKYQIQQNDNLHQEMYGYGHQRDDLDKQLREHATDQMLWNQWIDILTKHEVADRTLYPKSMKLNALAAPTFFEADQILKISKLREEVALKYIQQRVDIRIKKLKKEIELNDIETKANEKYQDAKTNKSSDPQLIDELQQKWRETLTSNQQILSEFDKELTALLSKEISESKAFVDKSNTNEIIYSAWRESVEKHPLTISDKYNVVQYADMIEWASNNNYEEMRKLWYKLATLFEESMKKRKGLMHKYHVFQLSGHYNFNPQFAASTAGVDTEIIWMLFDCNDRKIERIQLKIPQCQANKIIVYTADELIMKRPIHGDDDEKEIRWNNFIVIKQITFDDMPLKERMENASFEPIVHLHQKHQRYIKVGFAEFPVQEYVAQITVERAKFYMKSDEKEEKDEDELQGGAQLDKYKLKLVESSDDINDWYFTLEQLQRAYALSIASYMSKADKLAPYLIFDCETRQVDKFEVRFAAQGKREFKSFTVTTAQQKDDKEWMTIFADEDIKDSGPYRDNIKTINVVRKNKRYLKLSFIMKKDCPQFIMNHLKFYTTDPKEYTWDIDRNIKNLTRTIKVVDATKCARGCVVENIFHEQERYYAKPPYIDHKQQIENHIRDEICRGLNAFRHGGSMTQTEKHFIKFLLCWQNAAHYGELLITAKRVMNILSKPLIKEYKKLQDTKSRLLSLSLTEKDALPKKVTSNHGLLEWDYNRWYKYRKALFYPTDLKPIADEWIKIGLNVKDAEFKQIRRNGAIDKDKSFTSSDEFAMEYLNLIAIKLDPSFQKTMQSLFEENRKILNLQYPTTNADLGVLSGPIKTKSRQNIKVKLDYFDKPSPQCMSVLDIVRCAIVCSDDNELCNLFDLIVSKFSGKILRIKNAFDDINKGTFGYRAVLLNIVYGDEKLLPKGYEMICEVQLLLLKYYEVRKNMHLGYGIVRSEEGGIAQQRQPYYVLAQDSSKFGKLDI